MVRHLHELRHGGERGVVLAHQQLREVLGAAVVIGEEDRGEREHAVAVRRVRVAGVREIDRTELEPSLGPLRVRVVELGWRSEEHTSELQSRGQLVCRLLLEKKKEVSTRQLSKTEKFATLGT